MRRISTSGFMSLRLVLAGPAAVLLRGADWPDWRGPARTGVSTETGLPSAWSPAGENLAWKVPYGGRSGPVVFGDRLYLQNTSGAGATMQERLMCFHADTGKLLWEHKYNLFTSDVPPHRIAWASPVVDPATGNVFAFSGNGLLMSLHAATARCSGNDPSPKSSACGRRTADACRRRSSTAIS